MGRLKMKKEDLFVEWKGDWKGKKNFIPIKPNSSDIAGTEIIWKYDLSGEGQTDITIRVIP